VVIRTLLLQQERILVNSPRQNLPLHDRQRDSRDISLRWQLEPDPAKTSEVEVTFSAEEPSRTRVVLTHRHLERHGQGWEQMRDAVSSGWSLARFAEVAARR
jgi:hypothetical protein